MRRDDADVLARSDAPGAVEALRDALRCDLDSGTRRDWMTPGAPTLALYAAGGRFLASAPLSLPGHVRVTGWSHGYALLSAPELLPAWLAGLGVHLEEYE